MAEVDYMKILAEMWEPHNPGEWQLKQHFRRLGATVTDVSDNPSYWKKDIDLLVEQDGKNFSVEVKWDRVISRTGNLFIEMLSDIDRNKAGWFMFCEADYLYYGDAVNKKYYIFDFPKLKKYVLENKQKFTERCAADFHNGEIRKRSCGYIIPVEELKDLYTVLELEEQA